MASTINFNAVRSSPSIDISINAGVQTKFLPDGATKPLAIATPLIAWLRAPAPIACTSTIPFSLNTLARAPATELGFDLDETLIVSIFILSFLSSTLKYMY